MVSENDLPVAIIGGGPVGLAAAAQLVSRGLPVKVYEAGSAVGSNLWDWGHVRFSRRGAIVDAVAQKLLESHGWQMPKPEAFPTADEIVDHYLAPLAKLSELAPSIETNARVVAISRWGADKVLSKAREARPFMLLVETTKGTRRDSARAVIDASGAWQTPNPLGAAACRPKVRRNLATASPTASQMFSAATIVFMQVARHWWSAPAIPLPTPCSNWRSCANRTGHLGTMGDAQHRPCPHLWRRRCRCAAGAWRALAPMSGSSPRAAACGW